MCMSALMNKFLPCNVAIQFFIIELHLTQSKWLCNKEKENIKKKIIMMFVIFVNFLLQNLAACCVFFCNFFRQMQNCNTLISEGLSAHERLCWLLGIVDFVILAC
ncbi:hypothetical protein ACOSP7_004766 [Xanthoceras sorbifolium]